VYVACTNTAQQNEIKGKASRTSDQQVDVDNGSWMISLGDISAYGERHSQLFRAYSPSNLCACKWFHNQPDFPSTNSPRTMKGTQEGEERVG